jgi:hypothetical protein
MTEPYRIRSVETWLMARDAYLGGLTAETVCRIHDLGLSAFRRRARKYGWRRIDNIGDPAAERDRSIYDDVEVDEQIETARLRFLQTLEQGHALEARRWRKLWQELRTEPAAFDEQFFKDMTPEQISAVHASPHEDEDTPEEAALLSAPRRDPYEDD